MADQASCIISNSTDLDRNISSLPITCPLFLSSIIDNTNEESLESMENDSRLFLWSFFWHGGNLTSVRERERENAPPWTASVPLAIGFDFSTGREPLLQEGVVVVAAMACDSSVESMTKVLVAAAPPSVACADDPNCCWAPRTSADCGKVEIAASKDGRSVAEAATTCATPMLLQLRRALILNWRTMLGGSRGMRGGRKKPFDDKSKPDDLFPPPPTPPEDGGALVLVEDAPEASGLQSWHPPTPNPTPGSIDVAAAPACNI